MSEFKVLLYNLKSYYVIVMSQIAKNYVKIIVTWLFFFILKKTWCLSHTLLYNCCFLCDIINVFKSQLCYSVAAQVFRVEIFMSFRLTVDPGPSYFILYTVEASVWSCVGATEFSTRTHRHVSTELFGNLSMPVVGTSLLCFVSSISIDRSNQALQ